MTPEEQEVYDNVFVDCCSARDMLKLISHAKWNEADPGTKVIPAKTQLDELVLIHCGSVAFQIKEKEVINFQMGSLLGAVSFFTKEETVADYTAATPVRYLSWRRDVLDELFKSKPELKSAMYEIIGRDLVQKLIFQHNMVDTQHITMECI